MKTYDSEISLDLENDWADTRFILEPGKTPPSVTPFIPRAEISSGRLIPAIVIRYKAYIVVLFFYSK